MTLRGIEVPLLSLAPRLYLLRTLIISSLFVITVNIGWTIYLPVRPLSSGYWIAFYAFIMVHQIIR